VRVIVDEAADDKCLSETVECFVLLLNVERNII